MLDLLRIALCGAGMVYLAIRFRRFLRSVVQGYSAWAREHESLEDASNPDSPVRACWQTQEEPAREQTTISASRFSD